MENHFVYGDRTRIFINTALGCEACCQYCYLPDLKMGASPQYITAKEALGLLEQLEYFVPGPDGTILSIGCYSECWDSHNRGQTIELLEKLAPLGNYIQLATKRQIARSDLLHINEIALFPEQIGLYLSVPTVCHSEELEPGTDPVECRLTPLETVSALDKLACILYIKPVLAGITLQDKHIYGNLIKRYGVKVIIGPLLQHTVQEHGAVLVGEGALKEVEQEECVQLFQFLSRYGKVYMHSTDVINELRSMKKEVYR